MWGREMGGRERCEKWTERNTDWQEVPSGLNVKTRKDSNTLQWALSAVIFIYTHTQRITQLQKHLLHTFPPAHSQDSASIFKGVVETAVIRSDKATSSKDMRQDSVKKISSISEMRVKANQRVLHIYSILWVQNNSNWCNEPIMRHTQIAASLNLDKKKAIN